MGLWGLLVVGGVLLERRGGPVLDTCLFHRLSGHPCPTCGSTRVVMELLRGQGLKALVLNPLVALGLAGLGVWLAARLVLGRQLEVDLSPRERRWAIVLGLLILAANWAWVVATQA